MNNNKKVNLIEHVLSQLSPREIDAFDGFSFFADSEHYAQTVDELFAFMEEIPGGFLIYHADGNEDIIYANQSLIKMFRCDDFKDFRMLTGNSFKGIVHEDDLEGVEQSIAEQIAVSQDKFDYVVYRIRRKDGEIRWVDDYGHFIHSDVVGDIFYVFISDVTEEKARQLERTQALVRDKERKIQSLIEEYGKERKIVNQEQLRRLEVIEGLSVTYDTILYADLDSNKVLPYRFNHRTDEHFIQTESQREYGEYVQWYADKWVVEEDKKKFIKALSPQNVREKLSRDKTYLFTYRINDRGERHIQVRVVNVGGEKHISQFVIGSLDIEDDLARDRKQMLLLEAALRDSKLAHKAKNAFLSNMSHDMRTPLNAIFGYTALAKGVADQATAEYLDKIEASGKQLLELIDQVLEISQIESQVYTVDERETNLDELLREVCSPFVARAEEKNLRLTTDLSGVKHLNVYCDKDKLSQILVHIVSNAVKYTPDNGRIQVSAQEEQDLYNGYASYSFTVADNGIGIDAEALKHLFEPFVRVRNTTSSGVYGMGLGLTISQKVAEAMGGKISVESEQGKGSEFKLKLSMRICEKEEPSASPTTDLDIKGKKLLLTDDNPVNVEIEKELLEEVGFVVDVAVNGQEAVQRISSSAEGEYSLVLMDIQMPIMDGRKATELIRKLPNEKLSQIPIVAVSANSFEEDIELSMQCGMDAHLPKPLDVDELISVIAKILARRKVIL